MFRWFKELKRRKYRAIAFSPEWVEILDRNVKHHRSLNDSEREKLYDIIKVMMGEKNWEGCGGLELTDEVLVTISGLAGLLLLGLPHDYYRNVQSILVYPSTVVVPQNMNLGGGPFYIAGKPQPILGQAFRHGPVIVVWDAAVSGARHPESGHNVVYHEFAHKLDMLDGVADGTPILADRNHLNRWAEVCSEEYLRLKKLSRGARGLLNSYAATNEAEFFAVATEEFFNHPRRLKKESLELYQVLQEYYQQDPAQRADRVK
jgi:Mlc titration factor MtfA (ptsG expression regulator)